MQHIQVVSTRSFQCPGAGYTTKDTDAAYVDFIRTKTIVSKAVRPIGGSPSYVATNENYDFVTVLESGGYHVLYLFKGEAYSLSRAFRFFDPIVTKHF